MEEMTLENAIKLRDSYSKEIENLTLNLGAVKYLYSLVCKSIAEMHELNDVYPVKNP